MAATNGTFEISANFVDILDRRIFPARVRGTAGRIEDVTEINSQPSTFLLPGFVDSHIHIESSMLAPPAFAQTAVLHGTVATVSDPHEIGNVLGVEGVHFMLDAAEGIPFKFYFGAPSCVPATAFETAGDSIDSQQVATLLDDPRMVYLRDMMHCPGVLAGDPAVLKKIEAAKQRNKPVDGHAPGLRGQQAQAYIEAGISTDHECFTREEALDKLAAGAKILIREGSAARNFEALYELIDEYPERCMFCSDDKHPDELLHGHINQLVQRAIEKGMDRFNVLRAACINPVLHYGLNVGMLRIGDPADFIEVDNLDQWNILRTYIDGQLVADRGQSFVASGQFEPINKFTAQKRQVDDFRSPVPDGATEINVIEALDGQLITNPATAVLKKVAGCAVADPERDLLKLTVVNRYADTRPALAFIKNFGLKRGAIASSVAHDSHNVIAVGASDEALCAAVNLVIEAKGGLSVVDDEHQQVLPLPIAGLMSDRSCEEVGTSYAALDRSVKELGCKLRAPFMTLSFMALLVIPSLKLSDQGLFDGNRFEFISLYR
ncbi:MAG: adenine deaminase [Planctomycetales bacterium]